MHPPYGNSGQPYGAGREAVGRLRPPLHLRLFGPLATLGDPNRSCSATVTNSLSPRCSPRYRFSLFAPTCSPVRECLRSILHSRHSRHTPPHVSHPQRKQPLSAPQPSAHRPRPKPRRAARLRHTLIAATRPTAQTGPGSLRHRASRGREIAPSASLMLIPTPRQAFGVGNATLASLTNSLSLPATPLRYPRFALCPDRSALLWPRPPPFVPPRHYRPSPTESGVARVNRSAADAHTRNERLTAHHLYTFRSRKAEASRNKWQGGGGSLQTAIKGKPLNNPRKGCISAFNLFQPFTNREPL